MTVRYDTASEPPGRRLAVWQDIVCDVFVELDCKSDLDDFHGAVTQSRFGELSLTRVDASRQRVFRTPSRIARAREHFLLFAFGATGVGGVVQDGRETLIRPGEFAFYDTTRPYELSFDANFSQHILQVPRKLAQKRIGPVDDLTAVTFSSDQPLHRLASDFVTGLSHVIEAVDTPVADQLSCQALDLVAVAICQSEQMRRSSTHGSAMLYRLKAYIRGRLHDPRLCLADTAAALGISPRYVNLLLERQDESFGRYVLGRRLEACRRDLADPALAHRQLTEIALARGFNDQSHFSRSFKERFGVSPRDYRGSLPRPCNNSRRIQHGFKRQE
jgi:AraC-like DNA-binding protein